MKDKSCKEIRAIILKNRLEKAELFEYEMIQNHLHDCNSCKEFGHSVDLIIANLSDKKNIDLKPHPESIDHLKTYLKQSVSSRNTSSKSLRKFHYFAGIAAAIIIGIFYFSSSINRGISSKSIADTTLNRIYLNYQPNSINLKRVNMQIGVKSVGEDSLILQYLSVSM